jgi:4-amino-4-deoxy-L-arabinose transferase-like glycosyltransferase
MKIGLLSNRVDQWRIAVACMVLFAPFLGAVHLFDWDEINFAELAREMLVSGRYLSPQLDFQAFTEKPPLFMWIQALSMNLFGVNEFASRFPNVLAAIASLLLIYDIGFRLHGQRLARWWVLAYVGSTLPHFYFKSGLIDPWFNFFIFAGLWFIIKFIWKSNKILGVHLQHSRVLYLLLAALFTGLAILTKGPAAFLITSLVFGVYWISVRFKWFIKPIDFILYTFLALLVTGIWYGLETLVNGPSFIIEFTIRQWALLSTPDAGHGGFVGYHFVVLFLGCFPASVFAIQAMLRKNDGTLDAQRDMKKWMLYLLWVVLILFSLVKSKIIHYSSLAYFPLTYLAALSLVGIVEGRWKLKPWMSVLLSIQTLIYALVSFGLIWLGRNPHLLKELAKNDPFAQANFEAEVHWPLYLFSIVGLSIFSLILFFYQKDKQRSRAFNVLFISHALWVQLALVFFIGRIERITQGANIEFFESIKNEKAYLGTYNYRSYVPFFYGEVEPLNKGVNIRWKSPETLDRNAYVSVREGSQLKFEQEYPAALHLYSKNGFHFYKFEPAH